MPTGQHPPINLDANATTPLDRAAAKAMQPWQEFAGEFHPLEGNPSSPHILGRAARAAIEGARFRVAQSLQVQPDDVIFTGSATEANFLGLLGPVLAGPRRHLLITAIEHPSVLAAARHAERLGCRVTAVAPRADGRVSIEDLLAAIEPDTALVSCMLANNETGALQPVAELLKRLSGMGIPVHSDAVQVAGKHSLGTVLPDLFSLSGHKFHGPKGVGALIVRHGIPFESPLPGGGQEQGRRGGTENVAGILGLTAALEKSLACLESSLERFTRWRFLLLDRFESVRPYELLSPSTGCIANTLLVAFPGVRAEDLVIHLDLHGVCVSTGAACSSGSMQVSHVLRAMHVEEELARAAIRMSFHRLLEEHEINRAAEQIAASVTHLRRHKPDPSGSTRASSAC